ncbi:uncharacterized protein LOC126278803 [Schistocerca gregaria]|uniref:uncharacterized protein LOC126278803 n=1 Tax=Schistocerca gregaria TaxID=7010 RepID=UPI00211F047E|nr:uncharacterized protein LOC126278803 [Schistocerca gregaria]
MDRSSNHMWCDCNDSHLTPSIPQKYHHGVFDVIHNLSHPGIKLTMKLVTSKLVWHELKKDYCLWHAPASCARKPKLHAMICDFLLLMARFAYIWQKAVPFADITAEPTAKALVGAWLSCHDIPLAIPMVIGPQFEGSLFSELRNVCDNHNTHTTSSLIASNGTVELMPHSLKSILMCHKNAWIDSLPWALFSLCMAIKYDLSCLVAQLVFSEQPWDPGGFIMPTLHTAQSSCDHISFLQKHEFLIKELQPHNPQYCGQCYPFIVKDLEIATHVCLLR